MNRRYEDLERQLLEAKSRAEQVEEEQELARAAAAVARLTAPSEPTTVPAKTQTNGLDLAPVDNGASLLPVVPGRRRSREQATEQSSRRGPLTTTDAPQLLAGKSSAVQPHMDKVRALEEEMNEVLEVVNLHLGDMTVEENEPGAGTSRDYDKLRRQ